MRFAKKIGNAAEPVAALYYIDFGPIFFTPAARQNFGASFFPAYAAATCTTVILFFSVVQSNLCRFFSFRDMPKKNRAPGTRQVFLANFVAAYAIEILALFL